MSLNNIYTKNGFEIDFYELLINAFSRGMAHADPKDRFKPIPVDEFCKLYEEGPAYDYAARISGILAIQDKNAGNEDHERPVTVLKKEHFKNLLKSAMIDAYMNGRDTSEWPYDDAFEQAKSWAEEHSDILAYPEKYIIEED